MRRVHTIIGWLFLVIFLGTGVWMRLNFPAAYHDDDGLRMMFRASHIQVLAAALLNLLAGVGVNVPAANDWRRRMTLIGSVLLLASAPLLLIAFVVEPRLHNIERPLAHIGVGIAAIGTVLLAMSSRKPIR